MKRWQIVLIIIIAVILIGAFIIFNLIVVSKPGLVNCGTQGQTIDFSDPSTPNECCEGLENVNIQGSISVADVCYETGLLTGMPVLTCSDCGNGICDAGESVCGCPEDCVGKGLSSIKTTQEFCDIYYEYYCSGGETVELELCKICTRWIPYFQ